MWLTNINGKQIGTLALSARSTSGDLFYMEMTVLPDSLVSSLLPYGNGLLFGVFLSTVAMI